ncbi:MAG: hypothetical protein ACRBFS_21685 [Aureispira sp.]
MKVEHQEYKDKLYEALKSIGLKPSKVKGGHPYTIKRFYDKLGIFFIAVDYEGSGFTIDIKTVELKSVGMLSIFFNIGKVNEQIEEVQQTVQQLVWGN